MHDIGIDSQLYLRYKIITLRQASKKLVQRDRPLIGVLVDGITGFGRAIMRGVMRHANLQRRWLLHREFQRHSDIKSFKLPKLDGAIVGGMGLGQISQLEKICPNLVLCTGNLAPSTRNCVVHMDDYATGAMAAEHLMDCRLQHFAFFGYDPAQRLSTNRFLGFKKTLENRGNTCIDLGLGWPESLDHSNHKYWEHLLHFLKNAPKPIGIMAIDDTAASDLASACLQMNISVPDQVAIVGVNNDDLLCESSWPAISSIEADYSRAGYFAAGLLERILAGERIKASEREIVFQPLGVVKRQSTDILAVDDPNLADAVRYIREHACDPCNVDDVLRAVPVGRRWLERQFMSKIGRSPHDEITRVRVEAAKRLLKQPELSIPDIAARVGSSAVQNFCRTFEQAVGQTPSVYRKTVIRG